MFRYLRVACRVSTSTAAVRPPPSWANMAVGEAKTISDLGCVDLVGGTEQGPRWHLMEIESHPGS